MSDQNIRRTRATKTALRTQQRDVGDKPATEPDSIAAALLATRVVIPEVLLDRQPTEADIQTRAYAIYASRAGVDGDALSDWYEAERQLRFERSFGGPRPDVVIES